METLITLLNSNPAISAWKVTDRSSHTCELYYVGHALETNRSTDTCRSEVTIYVDQEDKRGTALFSVYPYMDADSLKTKIDQAIYAASFAMNPYFEIPEPEEGPKQFFADSTLKAEDFPALIEKIADSVFAADIFEAGSLNATEFFLYKKQERIRNSKGVDVSFESYSGAIEIIPSWTAGEEEVEVIHMIHFSEVDPEAITAKVKEELLLAKARYEARPLKEVLPADCGNQDVKIILQGKEVEKVLDYFSADLSYTLKYRHANRTEIGDHVQGEQVTGTPLNLSLVPYYKGAMNSRPFDGDGLILKDTELIRDGVVLSRFGDYRFGYYMGVERPAGRLPVLVVKEGEKSFAQMTKEPYIRCVKFSGIQVDTFSDYFGGEVRLGFYFDGEKEIPVTGFTISGNLGQVKGTMEYSSETITIEGYHGPKYLEIKGMTAI